MARQDSFVYRARKFLVRNSLAVGAGILIFLSLLGGIILAEMQAHRAERERQIAEVQRQSAERERARAEAQKQLAEQERARAESQRQIAERERTRAEAETQVARTEQERSRRRLAQMLQLANSSLFDVHAAIETLPGSTEARRQIVTTTLKFLENLSKDAGQDDDLRFVLSASYFKVANVLGYPLQPNLGDTKGALANYEKSAAFIEPLLAKNPDRAEYVMQWVQNRVNWATLLSQTGEVPRALEMLRATLPQAHRLPELCPHESQCYVTEGSVYSVLVNTLSTVKPDEALNYAQLQTKSLEEALKVFPNNTNIQLELGTSYSQLARVLSIRNEVPEAVAEYRHAVAMRESAMARNPSDVLVRRSLMITYGNLGAALGNPLFPNLGDTAGAREYYGKALVIARDLAKADPNDQLAQYDLASALEYGSTLDLPREEWAASLANLQEADRILHKLLAADPRSTAKLRALTVAEEYEGRRLDGLGKTEEAVVKARESLADAEALRARNPADLSPATQALISEISLGVILAHHGDQTEAMETERKAISMAERYPAPANEPDRVTRSIAMAYEGLATVEMILGDYRKGQADAQRSIDAWRQLSASGSRRFEQAKLTSAETILKACTAHLAK